MFSVSLLFTFLRKLSTHPKPQVSQERKLKSIPSEQKLQPQVLVLSVAQPSSRLHASPQTKHPRLPSLLKCTFRGCSQRILAKLFLPLCPSLWMNPKDCPACCPHHLAITTTRRRVQPQPPELKAQWLCTFRDQIWNLIVKIWLQIHLPCFLTG
jgi:hypothetical protein